MVFSSFRCFSSVIFAIIASITTYNAINSQTPKTVDIQFVPVEKQVWALYIGIYGNIYTDGAWFHWRRKIDQYSQNYHEPITSIPSRLYPQLGLYSSHDPSTIRAHFQMLSESGVDAIVLQWWGTNSTDNFNDIGHGFSDQTVPLLLEIGQEFGMKIGIEIQPYKDRGASSLYDDIKYVLNKYSVHKSYLKVNGRPVIIIYEPYSVKDFVMNCSSFPERPYMISTITDASNVGSNVENCFDGMFTFFAQEHSTWSTNTSNWKYIRNDLHNRGITFLAAVSPGHNNGKNDIWDRTSRDRNGLSYYKKMWNYAIQANADIVVINSFNGWFDSTNIEPAYPRPEYHYTDQLWTGNDGKPDDYLVETRKMSSTFKT